LDTLTPVRDIFLSHLLEEMGRALDRNFQVETDPVRREPSGELSKTGPLGLPMRGDFSTTVNGEQSYFDITEELFVEFDPLMVRLDNNAPVSIAPFKWNQLQAIVHTRHGNPNWQPIRRWYLEAFQSRFDEDSPEFHGVIHRISGPEGGPNRWRFEIDLGTANVDVIADMLEALNAVDVTHVELFGAESAREREAVR
jgi:hypothetical protein